MAASLAAASAPNDAESAQERAEAKKRVRIVKIHYRAHNGKRRPAWVVVPASYRRKRDGAIPLVISPHGRGISGLANARLWRNLPARGRFAVVSPDGHGRRLARHSWGHAGQVRDLARMPEIVEKQLRWMRVDRREVYAFGGSMGGQESLLLLARYPKRLAGVAVFDAVTDFALQYRRFPEIPCNRRCRKLWKAPIGVELRRLARRETGGTPKSDPGTYAMRSPINYARRIARSCVPLQVWWSVSDRIVRQPQEQSGRLYWRVRELNAEAPLYGFVGFWIHTRPMHARTGLPLALATFGLLPWPEANARVPGMRRVPSPVSRLSCGNGTGSGPAKARAYLTPEGERALPDRRRDTLTP